MSTKLNHNPIPVDVACAIVDVAPAAANTIWTFGLEYCVELFFEFLTTG